MISVALEKPPLLIQLDIPHSPLLLSLPSDTDSLPSGSPSPAPPCIMLSSEVMPFPRSLLSVSSSSSSSLMLHSSHSAPEIIVTRPLSEVTHDKLAVPSPSCASPHSTPRLSAASSKKLIEFIDFLENIDRDMASEIQHVRESIKEARAYVGEWQEERSARRAELLKKKELEKRETKEPDSDLWLSV
ncbi:hypothetical protein B0F90DRAFT_1067029 [Multifurca ochricompacta]|uniref:Uncharacterized protein n=1 Tax=Multifurca ochricompacta TaxID=376703 RepID=A0AAD4M8M3_9AGAM|nr:hypothetical protein B0F90DRAFT_1067029 [Multifurca ochricompacta]